MNNKERFVLVIVYKDLSVKTIINDFNEVCNEIEYHLRKNKNDEFIPIKMVVYDRKYSNNDLELNCYYEVENDILYSQFIDSYFGE